ncbi:TPA: hypothetical protein ACWX5Z_000334 [Serratia marcescens]
MVASIDANNGGVAVSNTGKGTVNVSVTTQLAQLPSFLTPLLVRIVEHHKPKYTPDLILEKSPKIEDKITFNNLIYFSEDVRLNSEFMAIVEDALSAIDNESPGAKGAIQWTINRSYKEIRRTILMKNRVKMSDEEEIRRVISDNSDFIFQTVMEEFFSVNLDGLNCNRESLMAAKEILVCYGFISCMILDEPK